MGIKILWSDKKRNRFGLPWTFTKYSLSEGRLFITDGFFLKTEKEIRLYQIKEIYFSQSLLQRVLNMGNIYIKSDSSLGEIILENVKYVKEVKDVISHWANLHRKDRIKNIEQIHSDSDF